MTEQAQAEPLSRVARRKAKTNRRLLEVARRLFSEKGIYWAKVEDITELADLGKGTFYKYFESKEAIIRVLLKDGLDELLAETERAARGISSGSECLSAVITARVDFFLNHPDYLLMFHQVRGLMQLQGAAAEELRIVYDAHLNRLAQLLCPAVGDRGFHQAREVATALAAYTSGLLTYHILFEGLERVTRRRHRLVRVLEQSLLPLLRNDNGTQD
jgi:AcrR family transcriptional regulator